MKTTQEIEKLGWAVETETHIGPVDHYRAYQGGFKTLWRPSITQTLQDVEKIVNARKDTANQRVPF